MKTENENGLELDREAWLTEMSQFILDDIIMPECNGLPAPPIRLSVGFPTGRRGKAVAVCYKREASSDSTNEIFVSPTLDDSLEIAGALCHEIIHAVDNCASGHRHHFARVARRIGLIGKLTATRASGALLAKLAEYVVLLGKIPHAKLNMAKARTSDGTRMLKCMCGDCGFTFRTSAKWLAYIDNNTCNACGNESIEFNV